VCDGDTDFAQAADNLVLAFNRVGRGNLKIRRRRGEWKEDFAKISNLWKVDST
jgi:hypothetical protein